jgi:hypothetical protein
MSVWRGRRVRRLVGRLEVGLDWWLGRSCRWHVHVRLDRLGLRGHYRIVLPTSQRWRFRRRPLSPASLAWFESISFGSTISDHTNLRHEHVGTCLSHWHPRLGPSRCTWVFPHIITKSLEIKLLGHASLFGWMDWVL